VVGYKLCRRRSQSIIRDQPDEPLEGGLSGGHVRHLSLFFEFWANVFREGGPNEAESEVQDDSTGPWPV